MDKIGIFQKQPSGYSAFIPAPFPPKNLIKWDNDLIFLLSQSDMAIGKLNEIDKLVPDVDFFIFMYIGKEATLSSQIEGTQASFMDLVKAEAKFKDEKISSDVDEIRNYITAMGYGIKRLKTLPLSLRLIKEIHKELLKGVRGHRKTPGEFSKSQNWIGGPTIETATFVPPPASEVMRSLSDIEKFIHAKSPNLPYLIKAGLLHAQFETIHPFLDGNGRVGRLLITFYLIKEGILFHPLLYLSEFFKRYRVNYYDNLNIYRAKGGVEKWLKFFLEGVRTVAEEAADTAIKINSLRNEHIETVSGFGRNAATAMKLLNKLYSIPMVDTKSVARITGLRSKASVNALVDKFVKAKILYEMTGKERYQRFMYKDYTRIFTPEKM